jgi:hypothetical protein
MISKQIEKWQTIHDKRKEEEQLKVKIAEKEQQLLEATKNEDYDLAAELQAEISKQESLRFKLEERLKSVKPGFIKSLKDDIYKLIEQESRLSTEKGIYEKTEKEKLIDTKEAIDVSDSYFLPLCVLCSPNHHRKFTILIGANFSD